MFGPPTTSRLRIVTPLVKVGLGIVAPLPKASLCKSTLQAKYAHLGECAHLGKDGLRDALDLLHQNIYHIACLHKMQ